MKRFLIFLAILPVFFVLSCKDVAISEQEKALLLTPQVFESYDIYIPPSLEGQYKKTRYLDGSFDLDFEFEAPEDLKDYVYIYQTISFDKSESDAKISYKSVDFGMNLFDEEGVEYIDLNEEFSYGDESVFRLVKNEYGFVGNTFQFRKGSISMALVIYGIYFDDGGYWKEFIGPHLKILDEAGPSLR